MNLINRDIYSRCLTHHAAVRDLDFVVSNSLPIPYFGSLAAFLNSPLRVLTAALNPSNREFPASEPRFDVPNGLRGPSELEEELGMYFRRNPYRGWFNSFEPVLNGLEATYGGKMSGGTYHSTALHLDLCSPIATSPTWSKLTQGQRSALTKTGREIYELLVEELQPHIIVASLGWGHIEGWHGNFQSGRDWERIVEHRTTADGAPLKTPLLVQSQTIKSMKGRSLLFVNATAADRPFGRFTTARKLAAGRLLFNQLGITR
jgi:hypothetical protein